MRLDDGTVKLTDFGIAKDSDLTALTGVNCTVGTAAYMSPEQCRGEAHLTAKSDIYSLGVVFFELLTGRKPFLADSPVDMFMKHVNEPPPRPSRLVDDMIPIWLDTLVLSMLEKKPEHRPLDAEMVGKALDEVMENVNSGKSAAVGAVQARAGDRRYPNRLARRRRPRRRAESSNFVRQKAAQEKGRRQRAVHSAASGRADCWSYRRSAWSGDRDARHPRPMRCTGGPRSDGERGKLRRGLAGRWMARTRAGAANSSTLSRPRAE